MLVARSDTITVSRSLFQELVAASAQLSMQFEHLADEHRSANQLQEASSYDMLAREATRLTSRAQTELR
jgi:hypothetical protein